MDNESFCKFPNELKDALCCLKCQSVNPDYTTETVKWRGTTHEIKRCKTCKSQVQSWSERKPLSFVSFICISLCFSILVSLVFHAKEPDTFKVTYIPIIIICNIAFMGILYFWSLRQFNKTTMILKRNNSGLNKC